MANLTASGEFTSFKAALSGQYAIERTIGRGGMGVVYLARDLRLDRLVAIKTLPAQLAVDAGMRERFLREARTVARLSHPNIVPIHRADEVEDHVFFVMGFVDGDSLAERLTRSPLSPRDALPILRDVTAALAYAHGRGVIHRDVKTENILLESVSGRAMVTDFGIARLAEAGPLTATGQVLGTVHYLSPEQVIGDAGDERSDIYALGVVGFVSLAGRFPFEGRVASAILVSHVNKAAPPLSAVAPHVPASLCAVIDRCLAKDPRLRFQNCTELGAALTALQPDVDRVTAVTPRRATPLISDTEAHAVFKRAAELQMDTGANSAMPVPPMPRDAARDAARTSGFKTQNLREAAVEAGIPEKFVEHALAERGLRPPPPDRPDRRPTNIVHDLSYRSGFTKPEPSKIVFELVIEGEAPEQDFDLLVDTIQRHTEPSGLTGMAASVGRSLTWSGRSTRGRELQVSIVPKNGRTTVRVVESLLKVTKAMYGIGVASFGIAGGGVLTAVVASMGAPVAGFVLWSLTAVLAVLGARTAADSFSGKRQRELQDMLEAIAAQARESIKAK